MWMTEEEAKSKSCPLRGIATALIFSLPSLTRATFPEGSLEGCAASGCAMWVWESDGESFSLDKGACGLRRMP